MLCLGLAGKIFNNHNHNHNLNLSLSLSLSLSLGLQRSLPASDGSGEGPVQPLHPHNGGQCSP